MNYKLYTTICIALVLLVCLSVPSVSAGHGASVFNTTEYLTPGYTMENKDPSMAFADFVDSHEPDDTFAQATYISTDQTTVYKRLYPVSDVDFAQFDARQGKSYLITTSAASEDRQLSLYLYGPDRKILLAQNCMPNGWMNYHCRTEGTHYLMIKIRPGSKPTSDIASYALSIGERDPIIYYVSVNTGSDPAIISPTPEPYILNGGDTLQISLDETSMQSVIFSSSKFHNIQTATVEEVVAVINSQITGGLARAIYVEKDVYLSIASTSKTSVSIQVVDGTAVERLGFDRDLHLAGDGSRESPWASIGYALSCIPSNPDSPVDLHIADGTYYERIDTMPNVGLYGGFNPLDWSRNPKAYNTVVHGGYQGSTIVGCGICQIEGLAITGGAGTYAPEFIHIDHRYLGGGIFVSDVGNAPIITNCLIFDNRIARGEPGERSLGGGIYFGYYSSPSVIACEIVNNSAEFGGGIALQDAYAMVLDNYVHNNSVSITRASGLTGSGGGLYSASYYYNMGCEIRGNRFIQNRAARKGGAMLGHWNDKVVLTENVFAYNFAGMDGGGLSFDEWYGTVCDVERNIIVSNRSGGYGGAIYLMEAATDIRDNVIVGNTAERNGGGIMWHSSGYDWKHVRGVVGNNVFCGNLATQGGGFFGDVFIHSQFLNNTVAYNCATLGGGITAGQIDQPPFYGGRWEQTKVCDNIFAFNIGGGFVEIADIPDPELIANNDFFNNTPSNYYDADTSQWYNSSAEINALVENDSGEVRDNVDWAPGFKLAPKGTADNIIYDSIAYQSILVDDGAAFEPNALVGLTINPDMSQCLHFYIISNTETTITTWGDMVSVAVTPYTYQVFDYHLANDSGNTDTGMDVSEHVTSDIDGAPRPLGDGFDIGADEYSNFTIGE